MTEFDWKDLSETWRRDALASRAQRHIRDARRAVLLEAVFAVVSVGFGAVWAVKGGERWVLVWTLTVALLFAMALAYSIWNRRSDLWPSSAAPLDFLAQTGLHCTRRLQMLRFMTQFGIAEVIISLFLFWRTSSLAIGAPALALVCAGGFLWLRRARRATLRELQQLSRLRDELRQDS